MKNVDFDGLLLDRKNSFEDIEVGIIKKLNLDLVLKFLILLCNSIGKANWNKFDGCYFINEIKNSSMSDNLEKCYQSCVENGIPSLKLEFFNMSSNQHLKIGYIKPIFILLIIVICLPFSVAQDLLFRKKIGQNVMKMVIAFFVLYLNCFSFNFNKVYIMTDHHFFSSIIAMRNKKDTYVLQHGLILDKRFYYPIRAGYFCAWGKHSKELLYNDPKVKITGTLKFSGERKSQFCYIHKIVYCISTLDDEIVANKIKIIGDIAKKLGYEFLVKCHPGSMFHIDVWKNMFTGQDITFYKEERIADLDFDLAISENSTINIDFVALNKPFIIYDNVSGYFEQYKDIIPICNSKEKLMEVIKNIDSFDFKEINSVILENELNNNICTLFRKNSYES